MAKSANENVDKERATTVYSQTFLGELDERGILDQQFEDGKYELEKPSNYNQIRDAIVKDRPDDEPTKAEYKEYTDSALALGNETDTRVPLYPLLFGKLAKMEQPHVRRQDVKWNKHKPIVGSLGVESCRQAPRPDLAEGLLGSKVPRWIRDQLGGYSVPRADTAFPNFLVELKRDKSMYTAHIQNRHCGAVASQAFVEYFVRLHGNSKLAWDVARVGSVEYNGDCVVGNIHWVSSSDSSGQDRNIRKFHMIRAMCRFTYGLSYEDFKTARKEVRNFREYFQADRETFLKECKELPERPNNGPLSISEEVQDITDDDSTVSAQQEASQPLNEKSAQAAKRQSSKKRNSNQAAVKGGGPEPKKATRGRKKKNDNNEEHTGLTQETQQCEIVEG
jgi:hypothetical protein